MIRTLLRYICVVDNDTDLTEYMRQVEATHQPKLQEEAMTIAEQLIEQGRLEGIREGRQEGRQEGMQQGVQQEATKTLLKILEKRFGSASPSIMEQVNTATANQLEAWIDASLDASSIEQMFSA